MVHYKKIHPREGDIMEKSEDVIGGSNQDLCISCGKPVPEGSLYCYECFNKYDEEGD